MIQEIQCYEDAVNLYEKVESNRNQLKTMLQDVLARARQVAKEVGIIEDQLFEADLQASRARTIIKKSGFADVLQKKNWVGIKITESNCSSPSLYLLLQAVHITQLDSLQLIPADKNSLSHWTNVVMLFTASSMYYVLLVCVSFNNSICCRIC